jgi:hypothetical protein
MATDIARVTTVRVPAHEAPERPKTMTITKPVRSYSQSNLGSRHKPTDSERPLITAPLQISEAASLRGYTPPSYPPYGDDVEYGAPLNEQRCLNERRRTWWTYGCVTITLLAVVFIVIIVVVAVKKT